MLCERRLNVLLTYFSAVAAPMPQLPTGTPTGTLAFFPFTSIKHHLTLPQDSQHPQASPRASQFPRHPPRVPRYPHLPHQASPQEFPASPRLLRVLAVASHRPLHAPVVDSRVSPLFPAAGSRVSPLVCLLSCRLSLQDFLPDLLVVCPGQLVRFPPVDM
jgi:hypothetical protein